MGFGMGIDMFNIMFVLVFGIVIVMFIVTAVKGTFQVASGDRMELLVGGREYGMLAEGDFGELTFQGTRYLGFERRGSKAAYDQPNAGGERQRTSWDPER